MLERLLKGCSLVRQCCVVTVLSLFFASRHSVDAFSAFQNEEPAFDYSTILYTRSDFDSRHRGLQENIFVEPPQNPCSLCSNSDTAQFPEKDVKHLLPPPSSELESFEDRISISQVTCAQTELFLGLVVSEDDKICIQARSLLAGFVPFAALTVLPYSADEIEQLDHGFWAIFVAACKAPLVGFFNCVVYMRTLWFPDKHARQTKTLIERRHRRRASITTTVRAQGSDQNEYTSDRRYEESIDWDTIKSGEDENVITEPTSTFNSSSTGDPSSIFANEGFPATAV